MPFIVCQAHQWLALNYHWAAQLDGTGGPRVRQGLAGVDRVLRAAVVIRHELAGGHLAEDDALRRRDPGQQRHAIVRAAAVVDRGGSVVVGSQ